MENLKLLLLLLTVFTGMRSFAQIPEKVADIPNYAFNGYYPYLSANNNTDYYNSTNANFTIAGNSLFFTVYDTLAGYELWATDGSSNGTTMIQIIAPPGQFSFSNFTSFNNRLYFIGTTQWGSVLWVSDGTIEGTQKLTYLNVNSNQFLIVWNGQLCLVGSKPNSGYQLFTINNDSLPLQPVLNLSSLGIINALVFDSKLYFTSADSANQYLWTTDGSATGTNIIKQVPLATYYIWLPDNFNSSINVNLKLCNGKLWFFTEANVWVSDGTSAGTTMVPNSDYYVQEDADFAELENVAVAGNNIYYVLNGENDPGDCDGGGAELVVSNGTSPQVLLNSTWFNFLYSGWAAVNNNLYFAYNENDGRNAAKNQLWSSDGIVLGTEMVDTLSYDLPDRYTSSSCYSTTAEDIFNVYPGVNVGGFKVIDNNLYFISTDGVNDCEVWVYNSDSDTTTEIIPDNATNCSPLWLNSSFVEYKNAVYYLASYNTPGQELWRINLPTASDSVISNSAFSFYPNPARSSINIKAPSVNHIFIYNLLGDLVKTQNIMPTDVIDISGFANGTYLIRNAENTFRAKFVKD